MFIGIYEYTAFIGVTLNSFTYVSHASIYYNEKFVITHQFVIISLYLKFMFLKKGIQSLLKVSRAWLLFFL